MIDLTSHLETAAERTLAEDVRAGLAAEPKELPPKHLYDARGSELFEEICELPEYYPTRTERAILTAQAGAIAARTGARELVELGSGAAEKARILLAGGPYERYVPVDVSRDALAIAAAALAAEDTALEVAGVVADFERQLDRIPPPHPDARGSSPSSAGPSATWRRSRATSCWARSPGSSAPRTIFCSGPTSSRTPRCSWPPTTTRRA